MTQQRLTDHFESSSHSNRQTEQQADSSPIRVPSTKFIEIDIDSFKKHPLWNILVETTHRSPLYVGLVNYVRTKILPSDPHITPRQLASRLSISLGEALVLLDEMRRES
ncbi:MAG: hypothetical protein ACTSYX_10970 [Candidatus Thorarchaeota archaeon]